MRTTVPRRTIELGSVLIAVLALGFVLVNATLVDRRPPSIGRVSLSAPAGDDRVAQTLSTIDIEFSEAVRTGSVERRFRIDPFVAGSFAWDGDTTMTFTPADRLPGDTAFTVTIEFGFEDRAGNVATSGLDAWAFRTVGPPTVAAVDPAAGTAGVAVDAEVRLTFDRLMDTRAVERSLFVEPSMSYRPSWSGTILTLAFDSPLAFGTTYTLRVGVEAADTDGSRLRDPFETTFTTVAAGLSVETIVPAPNVAGVSVRTPVALVFDAAVDPATIDGALRITPPVQGTLDVVDLPDDREPPSAQPSPSVAADRRVLLFTPAAPLAAHTTYTVTLAPVVTRLDDPGRVAAGRTWSFTTGAPTASAHNHVAFLSARSGVANVWLMNPDGSNPRQLTTELVPVAGFDVSGDGATLAWTAAGVVRVGDVDGSDIRDVTAPGTFEYGPTFSPDGRRLVVARRGSGGVDAGLWYLPVPGLEGPGPRQLTTAGAPPLGSVEVAGDGLRADGAIPEWARRVAFDPAGRFVFVPGGLGAGATLVDLDPIAGGVQPVGLYTNGPIAWSGDDAAFVAIGAEDPATAPGVYLVARSGGLTRRAATGPADTDPVGAPAVAPDGRIAAPIDPEGDGTWHIGASPRRSPTVVGLTTADEYSDGWPAFSPDGEELLFVRVRPGTPTRSEGIWVMLPDGRELRRLTTDGAYPRWIP